MPKAGSARLGTVLASGSQDVACERNQKSFGIIVVEVALK